MRLRAKVFGLVLKLFKFYIRYKISYREAILIRKTLLKRVKKNRFICERFITCRLILRDYEVIKLK
jgi:hypothetical protein